MNVLGIDIGGSGIKGAPVDTETGGLTDEKFRLVTPKPATPAAVADTVAEIVAHFRHQGPIGITYPGVVKRGVTLTAANVDESWLGMNAEALFSQRLGVPVKVLNDADAAGVAELRFGTVKNQLGTAIVLTFGTGIGSAIFHDGVLIPNTEFGHLKIRGKSAELRCSARIRDEKNLSLKKWAKLAGEYLATMDMLFQPELFIIGGGISKKADKFVPYLEEFTKVKIVAAQNGNEAGIIGAACVAAEMTR